MTRKTGTLPSRIARAAFAVTLLLALGGCRGDIKQLFRDATGRYDGFAVPRDARGAEQILVRGELKITQLKPKLALSLAVADQAHPGREWNFAISVRSAKKILISSSELLPAELELRHDEDGCFSVPAAAGEPGAVRDLRLCFDGRELSMDLQLAGGSAFALTINRYLEGEQPTLETPAPYTVARLRELARNRSFDSRLEFERVTEARLQALNAHLNLTPHVTVGDVLGLISFSWVGLVRMIGDLAPFALVNRWFRAHATQEMYAAEKDAFVLLKADSSNIAEGLSLAILRDEEARARLRSYVAPLSDLRDRMVDREEMGILPRGSSDDLNTVVNGIEKSLIGLDEVVAKEYMALAQAVGFVNPRAITAVTDSDVPAPEGGFTIDVEATGALALERAVELRQMDHLIEQARAENRARWLDWMDPSGPGTGVGAGMAPYIGISRHQIAELRIRRERVESIVLQKVAVIGRELDSSLRLHALSNQNLGIQQRRVQRIMDQLSLGVPVSFSELQLSIQEQMKADLDQVNARFEYGVARTKLNRVLFAGPYLELRPSAIPARPAPL